MARKMSYKEFTTRLLDDIKVQRFNNKYNVKKLFDHVKIINQIQSHIVSCSIWSTLGTKCFVAVQESKQRYLFSS